MIACPYGTLELWVWREVWDVEGCEVGVGRVAEAVGGVGFVCGEVKVDVGSIETIGCGGRVCLGDCGGVVLDSGCN